MTAEEKLLKHLWMICEIPAGVRYVSYRVRKHRDEPSSGCFRIRDDSEMASVWLTHQLQRTAVDEIVLKLKAVELVEHYQDGRWSDWDDGVIGNEFQWSSFHLSDQAVEILSA